MNSWAPEPKLRVCVLCGAHSHGRTRGLGDNGAAGLSPTPQGAIGWVGAGYGEQATEPDATRALRASGLRDQVESGRMPAARPGRHPDKDRDRRGPRSPGLPEGGGLWSSPHSTLGRGPD